MEIKSRLQLIALLRELKLPLTAAEVGVAEGLFSHKLLQLGIEKLYLIDVWESIPFIDGCASFEQSWHDKNYNEVIEKIKGYEDNAEILRGFSYKMAEKINDNSLGLVYLDGDHTYNGVKTDLEYFYPKLVSGGVMAGHDFLNISYGVQKAVTEFVNGKKIHLLIEDGEINNIGFWFIKE